MATELAVSERRDVAVNDSDAGASFLTIIAAAARDPQVDVAKMQALLQMQETIAAKQAEVAFNQAMTRLQPRLPVIVKRGKIAIERGGSTKVQSTFATYEDIDEAIRPLLCAEGFALAFNAEAAEKGGLIVHGTLSHSMGHSRSASLPLPADTSGSKNGIQAIGSTLSYARRYLVGLLLNIVTQGEDNDGNGSRYLTEQQLSSITDMMNACEFDRDAEGKKRFLAYMGVSSEEEIFKGDYAKAEMSLKIKMAALANKKAAK